jgi:outer membrane receptor protein involved in Fe transport
VFSAGVFRKDIVDFFGTQVRVATLADLELVGLDPVYVGWNLSTKFNSGSARITGFEFNARQPLRQFGGMGRYFTVFANATSLKLEGNALASFASFVPKTANWGFSFNYKRFSFVPKMNYRGLNKLVSQPLFGPDGFQYIKPRIITDLSMAYRLTSGLSLTASAGNIFNRHLTQMHYGSLTPEYARQSLDSVYGVSFAVGVRGNF